MDKIRLLDCDTGESTLDVVQVSEGFSLQIANVADPEGGYISIILDPANARILENFLRSHNP